MERFSASDAGGRKPVGRFSTLRPGLVQQARAALDSIANWLRPGGSDRMINDLRTASMRLLTAARPAGKPSGTKRPEPQRAQERAPGISVIDPRGNVIHTVGADERVPTTAVHPSDPAPAAAVEKTDGNKGKKPSVKAVKKAAPQPAPPLRKSEKTVYLVLLRHATAVEPGAPGGEKDETRPLDRKGRKEAKRAARAFEALGLEFGLVLTSPLLRAIETAQIVAEHLGLEGRMEKTGDLLPDGNAQNLLKRPRFRRTGTCILVVGHEPYLSRLASTLIGAGGEAINLRKCGAVMLRSPGFSYCACAWIDWMLTPAMMKMIA